MCWKAALRKAGYRIRVTAQLIEAETGNHICAERYDRDLADIFAVQDEISTAAATAIGKARRAGASGNACARTRYRRGSVCCARPLIHLPSIPDGNSLIASGSVADDDRV